MLAQLADPIPHPRQQVRAGIKARDPRVLAWFKMALIVSNSRPSNPIFRGAASGSPGYGSW
jgi:hypothetical protein